MASALERNVGMKKELEVLVEQAEGVRGSEPINPGLPGEEQTVLTETGTSEPIAPKSDSSAEKDVSYWKQRALTAEGRYNTLKPKLDDTIHSLRLQLAASEAQNKTLTEQVEALKPDPIKEHLGQKQVVDVLGEEAVQAITQSIEQTRQSVKDQLDKVKKESESTNRDTAYDSFVLQAKGLAAKSGVDIEALNYDKRFHQYLDTTRTPKGHLLRTLFNQAVSSMDADSVAAYFIDFASMAGAAPVEELKEVKDSISARIAPTSSARSDSPSVNTTKGPRITLAFINKFSQDLAKGLYKTRHSEMVATQKAIEDAYATNKIFDR